MDGWMDGCMGGGQVLGRPFSKQPFFLIGFGGLLQPKMEEQTTVTKKNDRGCRGRSGRRIGENM